MLGGAVARRCSTRFDAGPVPWHDAPMAANRLKAAARRFCEVVEGDEWSIIWAAGAATTSTVREEAATEADILAGLLEGVRSAVPRGPGSFFLSSSAGGVYAGSTDPPFDATSLPIPLSAYGELKLSQERLAIDYLADLCPVVIGRVSNLYGPGQNLEKMQGLISRLTMAAVTRQPINIFVPLDTIRDYIYADDAAQAVLDAVARARRDQTPAAVEVIASGQAVTVGHLIRTMDQVARRKVPVALGMHPSSAAQAPDLRMTPTYPLERITPLPAGMKAVYLDMLERVQRTSSTA